MAQYASSPSGSQTASGCVMVAVIIGLFLIVKSISASSGSLGAKSLYRQYHQNEVAADSEWTGQQVKVKGKVNTVRHQDGTAFIMLDGSGTYDGVQCSFTDWNEQDFQRLKSGRRVVVQGHVAGRLDGGAVLIVDCNLL